MTSIFLITLTLLIFLGLWVAFKYGSVTAYIGFSWVIFLASIYWWHYELNALNFEFLQTLIVVSFLLSVICLPMLIVTNWKTLSVKKFLGLIVSAFFHGIPFLMYLLLTIFPPR